MKYLLTIIAATTLISCEKSEVNNVNVPKQTIVLKGDITTNTKLTSNNEYILEGHVYVKNCSQLTIEPGTIIKSSNKSSLIIEQCSKIIANGTSTSPIVFTSSKPDGQKTPGDFGGLVLLGYATTNHPSSIFTGLQCLNIPFGGTNDNDNSGILRYVRIEYGGAISMGDLDRGALTLGGVGKGTTIEYIQSIYSADCSFYWMGGSVNASNLYSYASADDDFSFDYGYDGYIKNSVGKKDKDYCFKPMIGESYNGANGIECQNSGTSSKTTYPKFDNIFLKSFDSTTIFKYALLTNDDTKFSLINSTIVDWSNLGIYLDNKSTQYYTNNSIEISNNKFSNKSYQRLWSRYNPPMISTSESKLLSNNTKTIITDQQIDILSNPTWTNNWCLFPKIGY